MRIGRTTEADANFGRLVRTELPDGTTTRVAFTPWQSATFDGDDTVLEAGNAWYASRQASASPRPSAEEQRAATLTAAHAGTAAFAVSSFSTWSGSLLDEETGLYYHGARYLAAWLGRWVSADPAGMVDGPNLFAYVHANPIRLIDNTGCLGGTSPEIENLFMGLAVARAKVTAGEFYAFLGKNDILLTEILKPFGYKGSRANADAALKDFDDAFADWQRGMASAGSGPSVGLPAAPDALVVDANARERMWRAAASDPVAAAFIGAGAIISATIGRLFGVAQDPNAAASGGVFAAQVTYAVGGSGVNAATGRAESGGRARKEMGSQPTRSATKTPVEPAVTPAATTVNTQVRRSVRPQATPLASSTARAIPKIRGTVAGFREPAQIPKIKKDMADGTFDYAKSPIVIEVDRQEVVHVIEGHHRVEAALELAREGNSTPIQNLLHHAIRKRVDKAPRESLPFPGPTQWDKIKNAAARILR